MRVRLPAVAILAAFLTLGAGATVALGATTVRVTQPDGDVVTVDVAEIAPADQDVGPGQRYVVGGDSFDITGVSLGRLLSLAGVSGSSWRGVQVGSLSMTKGEYDGYGAATPPAFYADQGDAVFIVPDRGGRDGDMVRGAPAVIASEDERQVRITPDNREIDAGESITFKAQLSGGSAEGLTFTWNGTGLARKEGRSVTYRFPDKGSYGVQVTVAEDGGTVAADGTQVFVDPKPSDRDRPGGGKDEDDDAPVTGDTTPGGTDPSSTTGTDPARDRTPGGEPESRSERGAPPADPAVDVAGDLLAETAPIAAEEDRRLRLPAAREGAPVDDPELTVSGTVLAVSLVALLLGLGAGREYGGPDPRRWRLSGLASVRRVVGR